ncbi:signal peptide, CUB and EGF-like domain-containing protein 1 [Ruditapes philippinarum]|uniref:signal peptide, CUB and EGF-like domain-containing protein 1 n=1 Tax=Ruditapes philippinarum TaxID=129788 RepID=UPI00295B8453|nr:signal peptide, CUB and EGF-like domain-containing protein 1 [Ruditapes philippinarum]
MELNGGWSHWGEWSGCGVTCGGGFNSRSRNCNNPNTSPNGKYCEGDTKESITCNSKACRTCLQLKRKFGTIVNCRNVSATLQKCNLTCLPDRALANGQTAFVEYTCGDSTNHAWLPTDKIPECVPLNRPDFFGTQATVGYTQPMSVSIQRKVTAAVESNLSGVGCVSNNACTMATTITNGNKSRQRRATSTSLTVQFSIKLTDTGSLDLAGYFSNGTETSAMTELIEALTSLNEAIEFMQNNTESVFQVVANGVEYTLANTSVDFVGTVTCPSGYAGADGLCTQCPVGTYLVDFQCINCEIGTYQPLTGQTECISCPSGYTTATFGSSNISECFVNGGWSHWGEWSGCGVTCGGGLSSRSRNCNNPTPSPNGKDCKGDTKEIITCNTQACRALNRPDSLGTQATVRYTQPIPVSIQTNITAAVERKLSGVGCISNNTCTIATTVISGKKSRKRRTVSTTLMVQFKIKLTDTGSLDIAGYLSNGTETSAMTELIEALTSLNEAIEFMQNNTESVFQVVANGVEYTLVNTSVDFVGTVTCPSGYASADGLCTEKEDKTDAPDDYDEDESDDDSAIDNNKTIIIIAVCIVVLVVVIAGGVCLWKYIKEIDN